MRESLRKSTQKLVDAERRDEQARIAAELHDRIVQRVFALGLALASSSARRNPDLQPFIDETDDIIRDPREVIFNLNQATSTPARPALLRSAIINVLEHTVAALDFTLTLHLDGPIDELAAVLAVVRESLSNVARNAHATAATLGVVMSASELQSTVSDTGIGLTDNGPSGNGRRTSKLAHTSSRVERTSAMVNRVPGVVVEWVLPIRHPVEN